MKTQLVCTALGGLGMLLNSGCTSMTSSHVEPGQHAMQFEQEVAAPAHMGYLVYIPDGYADAPGDWPLILFLHGAGERGDNLDMVKQHGPPKLVAEGKPLPFIIVSPQCPERSWWSEPFRVETLNALLDEVTARYRIDEQRIYLTGLSMGGFGTWSLAAAHPERFAAIAPICGGGDPEDAGKLATLPTWVFHGEKDNVVPFQRSQEMVDALQAIGADVSFTAYPEAGHDSWTETYDNPEFYEWLLRHSR